MENQLEYILQLVVITAFSFFRTRLHPDSIADGNLYFSVVFFSLVCNCPLGNKSCLNTIPQLYLVFEGQGCNGGASGSDFECTMYVVRVACIESFFQHGQPLV